VPVPARYERLASSVLSVEELLARFASRLDDEWEPLQKMPVTCARQWPETNFGWLSICMLDRARAVNTCALIAETGEMSFAAPSPLELHTTWNRLSAARTLAWPSRVFSLSTKHDVEGS
jgi:hypothetical protein